MLARILRQSVPRLSLQSAIASRFILHNNSKRVLQQRWYSSENEAPQPSTKALEDTTKVHQLLTGYKREERSEEWLDMFLEAVPEAYFRVADEKNPISQGPDSMFYFELKIPQEGTTTSQFKYVLDFCCENGAGIAIESDNEDMACVFSYGELWHYKQHNKWNLKDDEHQEQDFSDLQQRMSEGKIEPVEQIAEDVLPEYVKNVIVKFAETTRKMKGFQIYHLLDKEQPADILLLNIKRSMFENSEDFDSFVHQIEWFLPKNYSLLALE